MFLFTDWFNTFVWQRNGYKFTMQNECKLFEYGNIYFASSYSTGTFDLTWTFNWPSPGASDDHYELEYSLNSTSGFQVIVVYPNGDKKSPYTAPVEIEAVDIGKTIYFRVRAKANGTYTQYSNVHAISISPNINGNFYPLYQNNVGYQALSSYLHYMVFKNEATITAGYCYIIATQSDFDDWIIAMKWNHSLIQGKIIQKAILKLYVHTYAPLTDGVYQVTPFAGDWNPNTLCYNIIPTIYVPPSTYPVTKAIPTTSVWEIDITHIVKAWANGTLSNYGIAVRDPNKKQNDTPIGKVYNRKTHFHGIGQPNNNLKPTLYLEIR